MTDQIQLVVLGITPKKAATRKYREKEYTF
ncbi:hypothetical protein MNBD_PLANCTO02-1385, partial [hydrothermal vent metagenome]